MLIYLSSNIMRTTINIDAQILKDLKKLQVDEKKTLGRLASELLSEALAHRGENKSADPSAFRWHSQPMGELVDLNDKEAIYAVLDGRDQ